MSHPASPRARRIHVLESRSHAFALTALLTIAGCTQWTYDRIALGTPLSDAERSIPEDSRLRSDRAVALLEGGAPERVDAVVFLLTKDALVSGKFVAEYRPATAWTLGKGSYKLSGELDPKRAGIGELGPLDTLRAVADDLTNVRPEQSAGVAHAWVAAGLVRMLQSWPSATDEGPAYPRLTDILELVPAGGESKTALGEDGVFRISYITTLSQ